MCENDCWQYILLGLQVKTGYRSFAFSPETFRYIPQNFVREIFFFKFLSRFKEVWKNMKKKKIRYSDNKGPIWCYVLCMSSCRNIPGLLGIPLVKLYNYSYVFNYFACNARISIVLRESQLDNTGQMKDSLGRGQRFGPQKICDRMSNWHK